MDAARELGYVPDAAAQALASGRSKTIGLRTPQEIALVRFDDVPLSRFIEPSLTTIHLPVMELARWQNAGWFNSW